MRSPVGNLRFVAISGALLGLLTGPAQRMQQASHIIDVITHTELLLNDIRHAGTGPQVGAIARLQRTTQENFLQLPFLGGIESRCPAGVRFGGKGFDASFLPRRLPAFHRRHIHPHHLGNLGASRTIR